MFRATFLAEECLLTAEDVRRLIILRNQYDYPNAHMQLSANPTPFPLAKDVWAAPVLPNGAITDFALDEYHRKLLNDPDPVNKLLGTTSKIFWGFFSMSPGLALVRTERHLLGFRSKPGTSLSAIEDAFTRMDAPPNMGQKLAALDGICQLGRMPFASKVVTGRYPEQSGVLDTQLYKGLSLSPWSRGASFLHIGSVRHTRNQEAFQAWCEVLSNVSAQLNAGIDAGLPWLWTDADTAKRRWRPVDVERAIFKFCQLGKADPRRLAHLLNCADALSL
ncbi:hypothetical protein [Burkholderia pseudomallei]|nr:hypothetical protein [Burkholderia pseudomallei]